MAASLSKKAYDLEFPAFSAPCHNLILRACSHPPTRIITRLRAVKNGSGCRKVAHELSGLSAFLWEGDSKRQPTLLQDRARGMRFGRFRATWPSTDVSPGLISRVIDARPDRLATPHLRAAACSAENLHLQSRVPCLGHKGLPAAPRRPTRPRPALSHPQRRGRRHA
jgi:hypothetical protein